MNEHENIIKVHGFSIILFIFLGPIYHLPQSQEFRIKPATSKVACLNMTSAVLGSNQLNGFTKLL